MLITLPYKKNVGENRTKVALDDDLETAQTRGGERESILHRMSRGQTNGRTNILRYHEETAT